MRQLLLALKLLWRDGRSGELTLLVLALLIAVGSSSAILLFSDRLQRTMTEQGAEFLAGDLVLASAAPLPANWLDKAGELGLQQSHTTEFASVLLENGEMLLASIKAVTDSYPLRGVLKISDGDQQAISLAHNGPAPGSLWLEQRILPSLKLKLGDTLTIGSLPLRISKIIHYEPDRRGDFFSLSPRVMMNDADLPATGIIQPGSRVQHVHQFSGEAAALKTFKAWLKPQLLASQKLMDIYQDRPELGSALQRAERYLGLSSIVVVLIAGVAIAMTTRRYTERHFNATALLRCLGCQQADIVWLYGAQFLALGLFTCAAGCGLGWLGQYALFLRLRPLLPQTLAEPGWSALALAFASGLLILLGFALPPLLRLRRVSPLRVLRRELAPLPSSGWLVYGLVLAVLGVLMARYTNDAKMTAMIVGTGLLTLLLLGGLLYSLLCLARNRLAGLGLHARFALQGLLRTPKATVSQMLAFAMTLAAMALSISVRDDLLEQWRGQLPAQAPNHFALNIFPEQQHAFADDLQQAHITSSRFYPVVRGRLTAINQEAVHVRVSKDSQGEEATQRELSLTWTSELPEDNVITQGGAWNASQPGQVSVEQKLAANLGIHVGDQLRFTVGAAVIEATVVNIRSVQWDTLRPNFYMIFTPGTLDGFSTTYLTSFYLAEQQQAVLIELLKKYPATTILEVEQLLKQFKTILAQLTLAIDLLLYVALAAGFTVLFAAVYASLDQRIHEGAVLRTLGARRSLLRSSHAIEFSLLGGASGLLAAMLHEAVLYGLYRYVMHMAYHPKLSFWLLMPGLGALAVGLIGFWGVRAVVRQSPVVVLRR